VPSEEGSTRTAVVRRPARRHARSFPGRDASIATVAATLAIVGALAADTGILARTTSPDGRQTVAPAPAARRHVRLVERTRVIVAVDPTVGLLTLLRTPELQQMRTAQVSGSDAVSVRAPSTAQPAPLGAGSSATSAALEQAAEAEAREAREAREAAERAAVTAAARERRAERRAEARAEQRARERAQERAEQRAEARAEARARERARAEREAREARARQGDGAGDWNVAPFVTWYGSDFFGNRTACGQRYSRHIIGVAHRTLPCGTLVEFRWHGITARAPVIDRGPYGPAGYVFDFSAALSCDVFKPRGIENACFTRQDVKWRIIRRPG
jgi:type IV secretory pathway VirB10-like protein